jgi:predicted transcriptional regulator
MEIMMGEQDYTEELVDFFKALADANRLKIIGLLAQEPLAVEQLAAMLDLQASTVSHHLSRLAKAGLVTASVEGHYHIYRLDTDALESMAKRLLARETLPAIAADADVDAFDRKVLNDFLLPDGRLKDIPAQYKKVKVILRHLLQFFEVGVRYTEPEVNEIIGRLHEDTATLRRELVDSGMMAREHGEYWRVEE